MDRLEHRYLGASDLPRDLSAFEIDVFFALDDSLLVALRMRRGHLNSLGLALQVCFIRMTGRVLNSTKLVSPEVLATLAEQLAIPAPTLASIRSLYRRRQTLYEHQQQAVALLGRKALSVGGERGLSAFLGAEASTVHDNGALLKRGMTWLHERAYVLPSRRTLNDAVRTARRRFEERLVEQIRSAVPDGVRAQWLEKLTAPAAKNSVSLFEELRRTKRGRTTAALEKQASKITTLRMLGAGQLDIPGLNLVMLQHYAERMTARPPRKLDRIREPARTIEIACFLRYRLLRLSDQVSGMADHRIARLWGKAHLDAAVRDRATLARHQKFFADLEAFAMQGAVTDEALGAFVRRRLNESDGSMRFGRLARARLSLSQHANDLNRIACACDGSRTCACASSRTCAALPRNARSPSGG